MLRPSSLEAKMNALDDDCDILKEGKQELKNLPEEESGKSNSTSELTLNYEDASFEESSSSPFMGWPLQMNNFLSEELEKSKLGKQGSYLSEIEMIKKRLSKLMLGEDMSGCGNGVCTALAISNAITNLYATIFGQVWRLEPLQAEKKLMWRSEMEFLVCVSDHIVELIPSWQTFPDGTKLEVMISRPRLDLFINLPALQKLDNMLLEVLDSFVCSEFWYVDQGILTDGSSSFCKPLPHQQGKWWLPIPRAPPGGLSKDSRKMLQHQRDYTNQLLKAAMAINTAALAEMEIPTSYVEELPKSAKACLGNVIYQAINSEQFSPESLLDCLDLSSDHQALEIANRVEATTHMWCRQNTHRSSSKSSRELVKDFVSNADNKRQVAADRAENLLLCLKQRFPGMPQTALDMSKIQYNKDVGKSILESYSRVLESLAFSIVSRIDDVLYVDDMSKHSGFSKIGAASPPRSCTTPCKASSPLIGPAKGDRSAFIENTKL